MAALFIDMMGSTALATSLPPADLVAGLDEFFAVVVEVIERPGGVINKFEGHACLAIFGVRALAGRGLRGLRGRDAPTDVAIPVA